MSTPFTSMIVSCPRTTPARPESIPCRRRRKSSRRAAGTSDSKNRTMRGASIEMNAVSMNRRMQKKTVWNVPARSARENATTSPTRPRIPSLASRRAFAIPAPRSTEKRAPWRGPSYGSTSTGIP